MLKKRMETRPIKICDIESTKHICYKNSNTDINHKFFYKDGVICIIENIIIDPSKWEKVTINALNYLNMGTPLLSKGFFNTKCGNITIIDDYYYLYDQYFNGWNYEYEDNMEYIGELAPGKTIFLLYRNIESFSTFHGLCEFISAISLMHILKLKPEDIKIIFLDSCCKKKIDYLYDLYKVLISRGGDPAYIRDIKTLVPVNFDTPMLLSFSPSQDCSKPSPAYQLLNDLINQYAYLSFKDNFNSYNSSLFYYPKSVIDHYLSNKSFKKIVTIQWRRSFPRKNPFQTRLMGNGPEMADKLASVLPKDILIRLVNTAALNIFEQISIAKNTDYFIGIFGAALSLNMFTPEHCINHEILDIPNANHFRLISRMSGHKTYSNIIKHNDTKIENDYYSYFDLNDFADCIINTMKQNNFFNST